MSIMLSSIVVAVVVVHDNSNLQGIITYHYKTTLFNLLVVFAFFNEENAS